MCAALFTDISKRIEYIIQYLFVIQKKTFLVISNLNKY